MLFMKTTPRIERGYMPIKRTVSNDTQLAGILYRLQMLA